MENEIDYAGKKCGLVFVFDDRDNPKWDEQAQETIDEEKKKGNMACCIHEGHEHGLYIEYVDSPITWTR